MSDRKRSASASSARHTQMRPGGSSAGGNEKVKNERPGKDRPEEIVRITIRDLNNLGCGVGRLPAGSGGTSPSASGQEAQPDGTGARDSDGLVIFIRGTVTGDEVEAMIIKRTPSYAVGKLLRVITPSPLRDPETFCRAPEACGGCVYRHLTYEAELQSKHRRVIAAFRKAGLDDVTVLPPLSTGVTSGYRNKGMYPMRRGKGGMEAGFYAQKSHDLIPCAACALQPPVFAEVVKTICAFCDAARISAYDETTGRGVLRHIYLRTTAAGELMVCLVINADALPGGPSVVDRLIDTLCGSFPQTVGILLNVNKENTNVVLGDTYRRLYGTDYIEDTLCGKRFRISAGSFYQVNHDAAELLYATAAARAALTGSEHLWDLYCGAGTIGLSLSDKAASVTGIEIVEEAVACARVNADLNASLGLIPADKSRFFCADAGDAASLFAPADRGDVPAPDVVVIDPPRKGTTPALIRELSRRSVRRVVYVSCDPETLARDCALFREEGYTIGEVQPVDLFARTGHVETVVLMSRDKE